MANFWKCGGMANPWVRLASISVLLAVSLGLHSVSRRLSARFDEAWASFQEADRELQAAKDTASVLLLYDAMLVDRDELLRLARSMRWTFAVDTVVDLSMCLIAAYPLFKRRAG